MSNNFSVLQNIIFDDSLDGKIPVYSSNRDLDIECKHSNITFLNKNKNIALKNISQIFPNHHYSSNTSIGKVGLNFSKVSGRINLKVFFTDGISAETLELDTVIENVENFTTELFNLKKESGYFYIKLTSVEPNTSVEGLKWITKDEIPFHKVLIGITTFKREDALYSNLNKIINSESLKNINVDVLVVDNGSTIDLSGYNYPILHTSQPNSGGTGGFMRSLKYAKDNFYTHNMFMDDDIELEPEMLYRAIVFSLFTTRDTTVGLMMMKKSTPYEVWEQGAFINKHKIYTGYSFNHCLKANTEESLRELNKNRASDFAGWWGCIVPTKSTPILPYMFIKGDDVISGLILTKMGVPCITLPTAMVWHEDFDKKPYTWQHFYDIRNAFMLRHFVNKKTNKKSMILSFAKLFLACLAMGDYYRCSLMLKAFEHGIKPSDAYFKNKNDLKILHSEVMKHFPLKDVSGEVSSIVHKQSLKKGLFGTVLTFFGTINPFSTDSCSDGRPLTIALNKYDFSNTFKHRTVLFYDPYTFKGYECKKSVGTALMLIMKFFKLSLKYFFNSNNENQKFVVDDDYWSEEFNEIKIISK